MTTTENKRAIEIAAFLAEHGLDSDAMVPLADDASFRRYFRVSAANRTLVLMDAPPGREDVRPFLSVAQHLREIGYSPPEIFSADPERGFVLLEDLGDEKLSTLAIDGRVDGAHYELAVDLLADLHGRSPPAALPSYDETLLLREVRLFVDWYVPALDPALRTSAARDEFSDLWRQTLAPIAGVRDVLVLLDYHADNLMWLGGRRGLARLGLLDFQDAVAGHPAYDLVSLLEDARLDVTADLAETMLSRYIAATGRDDDDFRTAYAILGAQRNSKIIGIFTRLMARDDKSGYVDMIPRVWGYLARDLSHPALADLRDWYDRHTPPGRRTGVLTPDEIARARTHSLGDPLV